MQNLLRSKICGYIYGIDYKCRGFLSNVQWTVVFIDRKIWITVEIIKYLYSSSVYIELPIVSTRTMYTYYSDLILNFPLNARPFFCKLWGIFASTLYILTFYSFVGTHIWLVFTLSSRRTNIETFSRLTWRRKLVDKNSILCKCIMCSPPLVNLIMRRRSGQKQLWRCACVFWFLYIAASLALALSNLQKVRTRRA